MRETTKCTLKKKSESAWPKQGLLKLGTFYLKNMYSAHCLKITQNVAYEFLNFGIFTNFCPIKTDLSGNTV